MLACASSAAAASKPMYYADVYFSAGSSIVEGEQNDKLDQLRCYVRGRPIEWVIVVGHGSSREPAPEQLAVERSESVKRWFVANTPWNPAQIHAEGKGARQPVVLESAVETRNRRVEIELLFKPGPAVEEDCSLLRWQKALLAPDTAGAMVVAQSLIRSGWVGPVQIYGIALRQKRQDLLDALALNIQMNQKQRAEVARQALDLGNLGYFRTWLSFSARQLDKSQSAALFARACRSKADAAERVDLVRQFYALGMRPLGGQALECAIVEAKSEALTEAYLSTGSADFITADMVVAAGRNPAILKLLLARGADPRSQSELGTTLFHTTRLNTVDDVKRLLDWGLDINARGRTFSSNPETTPLQEAVPYAQPDVLEFMRRAGADVNGVRSLEWARPNALAQAWLVRNGIAIPDPGTTLVLLAAQGESSMPVFQALHARGVDLDAQNSAGESALAVSIRGYALETVRLLVELGVDVRKPVRQQISGRESTPREIAESLRETMCVSPPPAACGIERSPHLITRKNSIITVLKAAGA